MKVQYWICDRCEIRFKSYGDITAVGLMGLTFELCRNCTSELKRWLKKKEV